jgi:hypothetical protein
VNRRRRAFLIPVGILIAVLLAAFLFAAFAFVPGETVNFSQSNSAPATEGINVVSLTFDADAGNIQIFPNLTDGLVQVNTVAAGSMNMFGSNRDPVKVTFSNQTVGDTMMVTCKVSRLEKWPIMLGLNVNCTIYVNPSVTLDLKVGTSVGKITLGSSDQPIIYRALDLQSKTGEVDASFNSNTQLTGNVSLHTTTGDVRFISENAQLSADATKISLETTTGSIDVHITQSSQQQIANDVVVNADSTTGGVNLYMDISDDVAAQVTSHTSVGGIYLDVTSFNGDESPIASSNYPAARNYLVDLETTTGSIHIKAAYQQQETPASMQEQMRDDAIAYIQTNHPETASLMTDLAWSGGRQTPEGLVGAETYSWVSGGWNATLHYAVVLHPTYSLTVNYSQGSAALSWTGTDDNGTITETSYTATGMSVQEQVRDATMAYIKANHPETALLIGDLTWNGGVVDTGLVGASDYVYTTAHGMMGGAWWTVEITYPVIPNPTYTVTANYTQTGVLHPYNVNWTGTYQDGTVTETSYSSNVPSLQEQARNAVMVYLENNHDETAQFMGDLNWTGGRVDRGIDRKSVV